MQNVSNTHVSAPKTLVVIPKNYKDSILPILSKSLTSPAKTIGDKIYAVLDMPKGKVSFDGMVNCDIIGA